MRNIELFHSYNYVNDKFIQKHTNFYNTHNKLIFSLLNIPNNNEIYSIKIQRILKKKVFSMKKNNNSYYTNHNVKIFLVVNTNKLKYLLNNNLEIPDFNILYKIILNNIEVIDKHEFIDKIVCFNKLSKKKINNNIFKLNNNFNFYNLNDIQLNLLDKSLLDFNKNHKIYNINGSIIFYDILIKLIEELLLIPFNTLFIINKCQRMYFKNSNINIVINSESINHRIQNIKWDTIILLDTNINFNIKKLKFTKIFVCINKVDNISINEVLDIYNTYFDVNLNKYLLTNKLLYNLEDNIIFRNYSSKLVKKHFIKVLDNNELNLNVKINKQQNKLCEICYENNINIKTSCNHYFCSNCIKTITNYDLFKCPYCRYDNKFKELEYLLKSKNDIFNTEISYKFKYLLRKSLKKKIVIMSNSNKTIKYLKYLFKFMNLEPIICNTNNIKLSNTIYFIEDVSKYNINKITNTLISNGTKNINLHFFVKKEH